MQKIKSILHVLFWIFVFLYTLEVLEYDYGFELAATLTFFEVASYAFFFYVNLFILIPVLLVKKGKGYYSAGLLLFCSLLIAMTYIFDIGQYYNDHTNRVAIAFLLNYLLYALISFLYWYFTLFQRERQKSLALQNEKLKAELLFLKSQVSPHFLFNSLNNVYSLSVIKDDNAPVMIEKLSDILRYIIYEGKSKEVPLEREVELIRNYIDLQLLKKLKAEKNIRFSFEGVQTYQKIAPLILINIVENCFKHSNIAYSKSGFLEITLHVKNDQLWFYTSNSFKPSNKKAGIGLKNIEQQLKHNYEDSFYFKVEKEDGVFKTGLRIDLKL